MAGTYDLTESRIIEGYLAAQTESAFASLFEVIYPQMRRYFLFRGFAVEVAEELAQDVMLIVYRKAATLRERELFRPWLFKVAQNTLRQHLRRGRSEPDCEPLEEVVVRERVLENEGFLDMISMLAEDERHIMTLRYLDELSYDEIAAVLDLPMGTVKWKIFNSKAKVQAHLGQRPLRRI